MPSSTEKPPLRRWLDRLYFASGALAAACLGCIALVMLLQAAMREAGMLFRGADDIVSWLCAGAAFLALGHTFRRGELVRVSLLLERFGPQSRWRAELVALLIASLFSGYTVWAVAGFLHESWQLGELAQGMLRIPIWIPQIPFLLGTIVLLIAVLDELVALVRGAKPEYQLADEERLARADFSDAL